MLKMDRSEVYFKTVPSVKYEVYSSSCVVQYNSCIWTLVKILNSNMVVVLTHLWMMSSFNRNTDCPAQQLVPVGL